jgi:hypothetical protein
MKLNELEAWPDDKLEELSMRTFTIELRVDDSDAEHVDIIKDAAKVAAKHLFATALLLPFRHKPQIALTGSDFFATQEEIELADDIPD